MFGENHKPTFSPDDTGHRILVRDVFATIQGEGPFAGRPALFVRLGACPLHCWFCDTDFEESLSMWWQTPDMIDRCEAVWDAQGWEADPLVVITGGEPLYQNIESFVRGLREQGFVVQIETSGAVKEVHLPLEDPGVFVVVSPKTPKVHNDVREKAFVWKYIIGASTRITEEGLPVDDTQATGTNRPLAFPQDRSLVWVQPMDNYMPDGSQNELLNGLCLNRVRRLAMEYGYNVSLQTHKILGVE